MDCSELFSVLNFRTPRESERFCRLFDCPRARTNIMLKSPLFIMTNTFNRIANECDIFRDSLGTVLGAAAEGLF